jgi:enoyl-CoA hydratase/carnithine racemase
VCAVLRREGRDGRVIPRPTGCRPAPWSATRSRSVPRRANSARTRSEGAAFLPLKEAPLEDEMGSSAGVFMSDDAKEGIQAFKEKRPPVWEGR